MFCPPPPSGHGFANCRPFLRANVLSPRLLPRYANSLCYKIRTDDAVLAPTRYLKSVGQPAVSRKSRTRMKFPKTGGLVNVSALVTTSVSNLAAITLWEPGLCRFVLSDGLTLLGGFGPINGGF